MNDQEGTIRMLGAIVSVLLVLFAVFLVIRIMAGDGDELADQMRRHAPSEVTGLPEEEYGGVGNMIADYLTGRTAEFQYTVTGRDGEPVPCFHADEAAHMADCRALIGKDEAAAVAAGATALIITLIAVITNRAFIAHFFRGMIIGLRIIMAVAALLGLWAVINFEGLFVTFHEIAFLNGGWRFNPRAGLLIRLMPTEFFTDLGIRGALRVLNMPILLEIVARIGIRKTTGSWFWHEV